MLPLRVPSLNWGSAPDPAPQPPEGLEGGAPPKTAGSRGEALAMWRSRIAVPWEGAEKGKYRYAAPPDPCGAWSPTGVSGP
ncbi:hypothetical protein GCM10009548_91940 [Streptomyces malaysiensis subsp. malaysiensis]